MKSLLMLKCWVLEAQHCVLPRLLRKHKAFCFSSPLLSQQGVSVNNVHYSCGFRLGQPSQSRHHQLGYSNTSKHPPLCCSLPWLKGAEANAHL